MDPSLPLFLLHPFIATVAASYQHGVSLLYRSFSGPNGLVPLVKEMEWLNMAIEMTSTPTCSSRG